MHGVPFLYVWILHFVGSYDSGLPKRREVSNRIDGCEALKKSRGGVASWRRGTARWSHKPQPEVRFLHPLPFIQSEVVVNQSSSEDDPVPSDDWDIKVLDFQYRLFQKRDLRPRILECSLYVQSGHTCQNHIFYTARICHS